MRRSRFGNLGSLGPKHRSRAGMWFAAFLIISLVMLLASRTEPALFVQRASVGALQPVRSVIAGIGEGVDGLFGALGEIDRLRSENDALRRELAGSAERIAELGEAAAENGELRDLLGIAEALDMDLLPVRITSRDPSNFTADVAIDAGTRDGLRDGMAVLGSAEGAGALAGTLVDVGPDSARVRFIVDTRSSVIALDQASRAMGLIQGQLGGQLVMVEIAAGETVAVGDTIISAGLEVSPEARSSYPKGLLIGTVRAVQPDANALTQTAFVRPALEIGRLERLLVVLDFSQS
ncbi:MAG: rod shape-determining protein MreC [Chloroflexota bacterium]